MTPDQCFDEMAVALGLPKDTGYIDILAVVKKVQEEKILQNTTDNIVILSEILIARKSLQESVASEEKITQIQESQFSEEKTGLNTPDNSHISKEILIVKKFHRNN